MGTALRCIGLAGLALYGLAFALTWLSPHHYERAGRAFIQSQLESRVRGHIDAAAPDPLQQVARRIAAQHEAEIARLRTQLASGLHERIAETVARMQDLDCECRQRMRAGLDAGTRLQIAGLERAEPQLRRLIEGEYGAIVAELMRELRIFTGTNAAAFAVLLLLSLLRPAVLAHLWAPGLLLAAAALVSSAVYLFGQNWFHTLLHSDYVGMAYAGWLLLVFGFFVDIGLNRARVTTGLLNALSSALGRSLQLVPC